MKILHLNGKGKVGFKDIEKPEADENHVIIKVMASALCGTEIHAICGNEATGDIHNIGHELVGIIEKAPENSPYKAGMRVGACVVQGCGTCDYCMMGRETACANKKFYAANAHAEYFKLGLNGVKILPDGIDWPEAALLSGDGLGVPVRASQRLGNTSGKKVLVLGLGPIGLGNVLVQAFNGAEVMGADFVKYRTNLAVELGAKTTVDLSNQDLYKELMDWTDGRGSDIVILAVGREDALHTAVQMAKHQGTIFQVAEFNEARINPSAMFVQKELTMTGSWYYTSKDWEAMLEYYSKGIPLKKLITHIVPFEKAQEAVDLFLSRNSGKVVLKYY